MKSILAIFLLFFSTTISTSQRLEQKLDSVFSKLTKEGTLHGCVSYVQLGDEVVHFKSYGYQSIEENKKMPEDAIFLIASMSKVITAAGALRLYEEGKFLLDDPVKKYLHQFEGVKVLENIGTDSARLVNAKRDVTIRDLFRHTAGLGYAYVKMASNDTINNLYVDHNLSDGKQTSIDFLDKIGSFPLKYHPGSKWRYSYSIDVLGFLIEEITELSLHDYLKKSLFDPLDMSSTGFYVGKENINRLSSNYIYKDDKLELIHNPKTSSFKDVPLIYSGGGGLKDNVGGIVTTAQDFANLCHMLLKYGQFEGQQILKAQTVELMISDQIAAINDRGFPVSGYGLGTGVDHDVFEGSIKRVFWAGGPVNTYFFIDFEKKCIAIFLTQNSPWMHMNIMETFENIVLENISQTN